MASVVPAPARRPGRRPLTRPRPHPPRLALLQLGALVPVALLMMAVLPFLRDDSHSEVGPWRILLAMSFGAV